MRLLPPPSFPRRMFPTHLAVESVVACCDPLGSCSRAPLSFAEEAFLQLCTDFQVVPLLTSQQAAREAFAHAVKPGPMGLALCWVGLVRAGGRPPGPGHNLRFSSKVPAHLG